MKCEKCGSIMPDDAGVCSTCGAVLNPGNMSKKERKKLMPEDAPAGLSRVAFVSQFSEGARTCKTAAILAYVCAGITFLTAILSLSVLTIVDVGILVVLGLLLHIMQSKVSAIILLVYSIINCGISIIYNGSIGGWLIIIAGVLAVTGSFKIDKECKEYLSRTGRM